MKMTENVLKCDDRLLIIFRSKNAPPVKNLILLVVSFCKCCLEVSFLYFQATLAASRQSSSPSNSVSQATSTAQCTVSLWF